MERKNAFPQGKEKRKNIIFYFVDQQRYDTFNGEIMPELTRLAREGVAFDNCFTCQPVCGPARACLQSGVYASECGCYKNGISLPLDLKPLAEYFGDADYDTAYIGKWHLASDSRCHCEKTAVPKQRQGGYRYWRASDILEFTSHGYDGYVFDQRGERLDFKGYRADCITDFALEYIENRPEDKPFFMFISQLEPHHQNDRKRFEGYEPTVADYKNYPIPEDLKFLKGDYEKEYPDYLSAINRLDYNLGRLIDKLKAQGIYDDTVIIYTSDHGCHFKTRNMEYKRSCHDSSTHIPLVIAGGGFSGGLHREGLVSLIDLPPTLLSLGGIPVPSHFKGYDLTKEPERDGVLIEISESQCSRAIRTKAYLYCVGVPGYVPGVTMRSSPVYSEAYLYDIAKDPHQKNNLIRDPEYKSVRSQLRQQLISHMGLAGEKKPVILPAILSPKK